MEVYWFLSFLDNVYQISKDITFGAFQLVILFDYSDLLRFFMQFTIVYHERCYIMQISF